MLRTVLLALLLALPPAAPAQRWGPRGCPAPTAPVGAHDSYEWRQAGPEQLALFNGPRQVGNYWIESGLYHPFDGRTWGPACQPPVPPPAVQRPAAPEPTLALLAPPAPPRLELEVLPADDTARLVGGEQVPTGVDWARIRDGEVFTLNGAACCREKAFETLEAAGLPDWSGRLHLTVIGSDAERKRLLAELPALPLRERVLVQDYPPGHWSLTPGFVQEGAQVYLQRPSGEVLARLRGEGVALAALRKADPGYDPQKDPDPNRPAPLADAWAWARAQPPATWMLAGLGVVIVLLMRRSPHVA